jgi:hypothetical protein
VGTAVSDASERPAFIAAFEGVGPLNGALEHLGFASEVIAARARVTRDGDANPDHLGVNQAPRLREDGSTDGHAVLWAG